MTQILDNTIIYATVDEKAVVNSLFNISEPSAFYYKDSKKIAYHWVFSPITVGKVKRRYKINA